MKTIHSFKTLLIAMFIAIMYVPTTAQATCFSKYTITCNNSGEPVQYDVDAWKIKLKACRALSTYCHTHNTDDYTEYLKLLKVFRAAHYYPKFKALADINLNHYNIWHLEIHNHWYKYYKGIYTDYHTQLCTYFSGGVKP